MEKCKHGMRIESCGQCRSPELLKVSPVSIATDKPAHVKTGTLDQQYRGLLAERARAEVVVHDDARAVLETGYVRIFTRGGRHHHSFNELDVYTRVVHINGYGYLWAIQKILECAPNVSVIELIPSMHEKAQTGQVRILCEQRAVRLVAGHDRPDMAWEGEETRDPDYDPRRAKLLALPPEKKQLLDELLEMGFVHAQVMARYFCLRGEEYRSQRELSREFGYSIRNQQYFSAMVNAVLLYLGIVNTAAEDAERMAESLRDRSSRMRTIGQSAAKRTEIVRELGLTEWPDGLRLSWLDDLCALVAAHKDGRLARLGRMDPQAHKALTLRFGFDAFPACRCRTAQEVADQLGVAHAQYVDVVEARGLEKLARLQQVDKADLPGLPHGPDGLAQKRFALYRELLTMREDGRLRALEQEDANAHRALALRFGLDTLEDPQYRTLQQAADIMDLSRQRVKQLEERALAKLGIQKGE